MFDILTPSSPHSFAANTYFFVSENEAAVIDPTVPYDPIKFPQKIKYIILTHAHFDHILEINSWTQSGAEVIVCANEQEALSDSYRNCYRIFFGKDHGYYGDYRAVHEGDILCIGDEQLRIMECPGHTLGCMSIIGNGFAFVGDTVFERGGFGRCDLPTGDFDALRTSIARICSLAEDTVLYSGHGGAFTVREYKRDFKF